MMAICRGCPKEVSLDHKTLHIKQRTYRWPSHGCLEAPWSSNVAFHLNETQQKKVSQTVASLRRNRPGHGRGPGEEGSQMEVHVPVCTR